MDALADLRAKALAAREFTHEVGECSYRLRVPTRTEVRQTAQKHGMASGSVVELLLIKTYLVQRFLVGWTGVRNSHIVPDAGKDPLPHSPEAVALWIDANPDLADQLGEELARRSETRAAEIEAAAGN
jgi:hypothetical protein